MNIALKKNQTLGFTLLELLLAVLIIAVLGALLGAAAMEQYNKSKKIATGGALIQTATLATGGNKIPVNGSGAGVYLALRKTNMAPGANRATTLKVVNLMPLNGTLSITPTTATTDTFPPRPPPSPPNRSRRNGGPPTYSGLTTRPAVCRMHFNTANHSSGPERRLPHYAPS